MSERKYIGVDKDIRVLSIFIEIYCDGNHRSEDKFPWAPSEALLSLGNLSNPILCKNCIDLMEYSSNRRRLCPLDPKPTCKTCESHCYSGEHRDRIREVMKFSGKHYLRQAITHGRFKEIWEVLTHLL